MTTHPDAAQIAAKLTEAQREALMLSINDPKRHGPYHIFPARGRGAAFVRDLLELDLVNYDDELGGHDIYRIPHSPFWNVIWSPLGLAVRAELEKK